ncbi:nitrite reductase/ring-hydroxylating ferredoxin subunit [Nonlabens dokdonensis]|uniref:Secreted protein n=4 Tax=Nonlabens dokdonensis TaxID=328515 RepID=L7WAL5_NONDD|nr:secreted protein [Nonlabens dokdonensis DSW-6]PZX36804.1 nitrite reductase/ring-hydroxylating ferredoxin subunit [Nonlabens dokdonensis]
MKMRKAYLLSLMFVIFACSSDDGRNNNPFLVDIGFQVDLNTNLPQFGNLNFPGNSLVVPNQGLRGFVIYNLDNSQYVAYELSDPNHSPNSCSRMTISGIEATCPCTDDNNKYNIITGQPIQGNGQYGLKAYRAERIGAIIRVSN